jgi:N-acetylmuramoyl-L-alanine amidase
LGALLVVPGLGAQSLQSLADKTGAQIFWEPYRDQVLLADIHHRLSVDMAAGLARGDGDTVFELTSLDAKTGVLGVDDYQRLLAWWNNEKPPLVATTPPSDPVVRRPESAPKGPRIQVLVLDAGHGGSDPGSIGRHTLEGKPVVLQEKDLTLAVVLELKRLLTETYPDRNIVLTRQGDTYPTLEKRVQIAHAQKLEETDSIFFLSVHFNASLNRKAKGLEFWYVPQDYERDVLSEGDIPDSVFPVLNTLVDGEYKKESRELAVQLAAAVGKELGDANVQRGLKENPWFVVRMAKMPAVLAELGFITNPDEAASLQDPEYLKKLARGLYNGLVSFIQTYEDHP